MLFLLQLLPSPGFLRTRQPFRPKPCRARAGCALQNLLETALAQGRGRNALPPGFTGHCQPLQNRRAAPSLGQCPGRSWLPTVGIAQGRRGRGGWQPGSSSAGTAAAEALPAFLSACLSLFPHMVQEGCLLAGYGAQDLSLQSSQELCPLTARASRVCWRCNLQVKAAWKPLLKGCCCQHQQELWTGFLVTSFHSSTSVSLYSCCAVKGGVKA